MRRGRLPLAGAAACALALAAPAPAGTPRAALEASLEDVAREAPGTVGIFAAIVERDSAGRSALGLQVSVNGDLRFPLGSVYKIPIALAVLDAADRGALSLGEPVPVGPEDLAPGWSPIADRHPQGGVAIPVRDLLDAMLTQSDNTACDVLLARVGGPAAVTARVRALGVPDVRVDRPERRMGSDWFGVTLEPESTWTRASIAAARDRLPDSTRARAAAAFVNDPRDSGTPAGIATLLRRTLAGEALSPAMTGTLLGLMRRSATGPGRLRAGLPRGAELAHKTGSSGTWRGATACVNDAGIVTLPGGGHAIVVVLIKDVRGPVADAERSIARVAREVWAAWGSNPVETKRSGAPPGRR
jgi:beta-lactamase class A